MPRETQYGQNLRDVVEDIRSGPLFDMRAAGLLTAADLRRGAERAEADARFRRSVAEQMERAGTESLTVNQLAQMYREVSHG